MRRKSIVTIVGARPQFIKAAAVSRAIRDANAFDEAIVHTGQHYDPNMSDVFFAELEIPAPVEHLGVGGGSHGEMTGRMLEGIERVLIARKPDAVMVYGDTNSTVAGALAAAKLHVPIVHVEAGLRSFNRRMPEEINRVLTDHLSALLLAPTQEGIRNLAAEGIAKGVVHVGDVMYDATLHAIKRTKAQSAILKTLGLENRPFALCTLHRAENTDDPARFESVLHYLETEAERRAVVFPIHPRTRKTLHARGRTPKNFILTEPLGYFDLHRLLGACDGVFTDSGGLQKEAYFHRKPCVTLREETEWVETIDAGWNRLWRGPDFITPRRDIADYGAGDAAEKCVREIAKLIGA